MRRKIRLLDAALVLILVIIPWPAWGAFSTLQPPNIVFILADDLGWADLGCYGADLHETPHLDHLARQGLRFTQAYAMSVCSPTRAAILTGQHAARLRMTVWREASLERPARVLSSKSRLLPPVTVHDLPHAQVTVAERLKAVGYLTFHVGKWHLGDADHSPETQGFDVNIGGTHWGAPNSYFWPFRGTNRFGDFRYVPALGLGQPGDYLTDRLADEAIRLIDAAGGRPFFLNLWFHSPHTPIEGKPKLVAYYEAKRRPSFHHQDAGYAAMVHALDENVGRVLHHLESRGLADRTIVIFTSDNGGYVNAERTSSQPVTTNWPLRSGKGSLYEGGIRVPLITRWPSTIPPGTVTDQPVTCMDFCRTLAELGGAGDDTSPDGVSLLPVLRDPKATLPRDTLFFHFPHYYATTTPVSAVRHGDWKLLEYLEDGRVELYNLKGDPGETADLADREPDRVRTLRARLDSWRRELDVPMPTPNLAAPQTQFRQNDR
jgi:arylsulfatase A-like enzyme